MRTALERRKCDQCGKEVTAEHVESGPGPFTAWLYVERQGQLRMDLCSAKCMRDWLTMPAPTALETKLANCAYYAKQALESEVVPYQYDRLKKIVEEAGPLGL
jgi:hypothetical protein